jgi:hypothetical protein
MLGDEALGERLRLAVAQVVNEHLAGATSAGRLGGFLLSFDWVDIGDAAGEHLVVDGRDPHVAAKALVRTLYGVGRPGSPGSRAR